MDSNEEEIELARGASSGSHGDAAIEPSHFAITEDHRMDEDPDAKIEAEIERALLEAEAGLNMAEEATNSTLEKKDMAQFMQFQTGYKKGYTEGYRSGFRAGYRDYQNDQEAPTDACSEAGTDVCIRVRTTVIIAPDGERQCRDSEWEKIAQMVAEAEDEAEDEQCEEAGGENVEEAEEAAESEDEHVEEAEDKHADEAEDEQVDEAVGDNKGVPVDDVSSDAVEDSPDSMLAAGPAAAKVVKWLSDDTCMYLSADTVEMKAVVKLLSADGAVKPSSMALKQFITKHAVAAVDRVNELRERHPHCRGRPLTQSYRLCLQAAAMANSLACRGIEEAASGLNDEGDCNVMTVLEQGERLSMGIAVHRFERSPRTSLPKQSVNFWYKTGKSFPYDDRNTVEKIANQAAFIQLLDCHAQYMGWAAAMADTGAVYAVSVFDHIGAADPKSISSMAPATEAADSEDEENPDSSPNLPSAGRKRRGFNYSAPAAMPMQQLVHRLPGVFRMFKDASLEDAPLEQQEDTAVSLCNLVIQKAHERIVQMRRKHRRTEPLSLSPSLCNFALMTAHDLAVQENKLGRPIEPSGNSVIFPDVGEQLGVVTCRLVDFGDVAKQSVEHWCRGSTTFPYGHPLEAIKCLEFKQFAQLMDFGSRYMGWGASLANSGAAYAVALFNNVGSTERKNLTSLKKAINGIRVMF